MEVKYCCAAIVVAYVLALVLGVFVVVTDCGQEVETYSFHATVVEFHESGYYQRIGKMWQYRPRYGISWVDGEESGYCNVDRKTYDTLNKGDLIEVHCSVRENIFGGITREYKIKD